MGLRRLPIADCRLAIFAIASVAVILITLSTDKKDQSPICNWQSAISYG
jgi:hypothetical protein